MYQGAWVYPGLKPGYHSSVMNSSTGMTVAIASPRAGWAPFTARYGSPWAAGNGQSPLVSPQRLVVSPQSSVPGRDAERLGVARGVARRVVRAGAGPAHRRRPPVPPAEQHDRGRHQQGADEEGVHQDAQREARTDVAELGGSLLGAHDREDGEGAAEHEAGRRDRGAGRGERMAHRVLQ